MQEIERHSYNYLLLLLYTILSLSDIKNVFQRLRMFYMQHLSNRSGNRGSRTGTSSDPEPDPIQNRIRSSTGSDPDLNPTQNWTRSRTGSDPEPAPIQNRIRSRTGSDSEPDPIQNRIRFRTGSDPEPDPIQNRIRTRTGSIMFASVFIKRIFGC